MTFALSALRGAAPLLSQVAQTAARNSFGHVPVHHTARLPAFPPTNGLTALFAPSGQARGIFAKVEQPPPDCKEFFHGTVPPYGHRLVEEGDADLGDKCAGREAGDGGAARIGGLYITNKSADAQRWASMSSYNLLGITELVQVFIPPEAKIARVPEEAVGNPNMTKQFANENADAHVVMITGEKARLQLGVVTEKGATDPDVTIGVRFASAG